MRMSVMILAVPLLVACEASRENLEAGAWRPTGANEQNLRLMVARPSDLLRGVGEPGADGHGAAQAVDRLRTDRVRPLPESGVARLVPTASSGAN